MKLKVFDFMSVKLILMSDTSELLRLTAAFGKFTVYYKCRDIFLKLRDRLILNTIKLNLDTYFLKFLTFKF